MKHLSTPTLVDMKLKLDLQVAVDCDHLPSEALFERWLDHTLTFLAKNNPESLSKFKSASGITIRIVDCQESAELNQTYRNKAGATNILSFPAVFFPGMETQDLGDLAICAELVESEANAQRIPIENHWAHLLVHGILHLIGYDHITDDEAAIMEPLEIAILAELGIVNPYE